MSGYTEEHPRPCLWCEFDVNQGMKRISSEESAQKYFDTYGPKLVVLPKRLRGDLIDTRAIQCRNCGLITPGGKTPKLSWKYWNDGTHK